MTLAAPERKALCAGQTLTLSRFQPRRLSLWCQQGANSIVAFRILQRNYYLPGAIIICASGTLFICSFHVSGSSSQSETETTSAATPRVSHTHFLYLGGKSLFLLVRTAFVHRYRYVGHNNLRYVNLRCILPQKRCFVNLQTYRRRTARAPRKCWAQRRARRPFGTRCRGSLQRSSESRYKGKTSSRFP